MLWSCHGIITVDQMCGASGTRPLAVTFDFAPLALFTPIYQSVEATTSVQMLTRLLGRSGPVLIDTTLRGCRSLFAPPLSFKSPDTM